jgi:hypothetical protein
MRRLSSTKRANVVTTTVWRILCLLVGTLAVLAFTPVLWVLHPVVQGMAILLVLSFALVIEIARYSDSATSQRRSVECSASDEV